MTSPKGRPLAVVDGSLALRLLEEAQGLRQLVSPCLRDLLATELDLVHGREQEAARWVAEHILDGASSDDSRVRPSPSVAVRMLERCVFPRARLAVAIDYLRRFPVAPPELLWPTLGREAITGLLQQALDYDRCPAIGYRLAEVHRYRDIAHTYDRYVAGGGAAAVKLAPGSEP